jgi:hypothetical protein
MGKGIGGIRGSGNQIDPLAQQEKTEETIASRTSNVAGKTAVAVDIDSSSVRFFFDNTGTFEQFRSYENIAGVPGFGLILLPTSSQMDANAGSECFHLSVWRRPAESAA